ncbi:glycerophosphodiester phosphodiesterase family protein [Thermodesulfobacteriota bacterium]
MNIQRKTLKFHAVVLFVALCTLASCSDGDGGPATLLAFPEGILNVGHGGAKDLCPANTLECFQLAMDEGANALEVDIQVLGDGTLVTYHDGNTLGQTGEDHRVLDLTIDEMKQLDAGWGFTPDEGATYPYRGLGIEVPTFAEFLEVFRRVPVLLDVKTTNPEMADALIPFVTDHFDDDACEFVFIKTHDMKLTNTIRRLHPPVRVAFNTTERILLAIFPFLFKNYPPTWLDLNPEYLFAHIIAWSESHDHILTVSTVDEAEAMEEFLEIEELDGIVTNRPDLLDELLNP